MTITIPAGMERLGETMNTLLKDVLRKMKQAAPGRTLDDGNFEDGIANAKRTAEIERESYRVMRQSLDIDESTVLVPVHEAITYLTNHKNVWATPLLVEGGVPVGSIEATCKSLFEIRMRRPKARWKNHTGSHIVQLRVFALSDRWDQTMLHVLTPLRITVRPLKTAS